MYFCLSCNKEKNKLRSRLGASFIKDGEGGANIFSSVPLYCAECCQQVTLRCRKAQPAERCLPCRRERLGRELQPSAVQRLLETTRTLLVVWPSQPSVPGGPASFPLICKA